MDIISMAYAKKLVNGLQSGLDNASVNNDTCSITFHWKNGTSSTMTFPKPLDGANGVGISDVKLKEVTVGSDKETHLICTLDDGTEIDAGNIPRGTTDYADLTNKPSINSIELSGNKTLADLGITNYDDTQVKADIGKKANTTDLTNHTGDTNIHVTSDERTKWNKAITEDQLYGYIPYFPKGIQFGHLVDNIKDSKWVKIFEFTPNRYDWNGGNFIIAFSFLNPANSYYPFSEYELIWECDSDGTSGITDVYLKQIISQNGDVCHTNGSALCVGISENKKTVELYAFLGISSYQTMLATIISGGSRYEYRQAEIAKWINIDTPTKGLTAQPTFSKANYYSLADNLGGWTYTATKLPVLNYTNVVAKTQQLKSE
ncbi:MAG: hypothetical protein MSA56_05005 [Clostridium sp.]|nr:hypothetical protein [Clostridium sp.]